MAAEGAEAFGGSPENITGSVLGYSDFIVFDLAPYVCAGSEARGAEPLLSPEAFAWTRKVARWPREVLSSLSLFALARISGETGLRICVLVSRRLDYGVARPIAGTANRSFVSQHGAHMTTEWSVGERKGRILSDHKRNARGKMLVGACFPRALPGATGAIPLFREEPDDVHPTDFTMGNVPARLARYGHPWRGIPGARGALARALGEDGFPRTTPRAPPAKERQEQETDLIEACHNQERPQRLSRPL